MKIWLDDLRPAENIDYVVCATAEQAIALINLGDVTFISFDHDLGEGLTGYDVAKFIEEGAHTGSIRPIFYKIHSANPVGRKNIEFAMNSALDAWRKMK